MLRYTGRAVSPCCLLPRRITSRLHFLDTSVGGSLPRYHSVEWRPMRSWRSARLIQAHPRSCPVYSVSLCPFLSIRGARQGLIDFLLGSSEEARRLRDGVLFKIVPMLNPDGV